MKKYWMSRMNNLKRMALTALFLSGGFAASGELTRDQLIKLKAVKLSGVKVSTTRDDQRNKIEVVEVNAFHNEEDRAPGFRMRIVVALTDKNKNRYLVDFSGSRPGGQDIEYTGEDYWNLYIPHGDLERLKVEGYYVEYGFVDDPRLIILDRNFKRGNSLEELTAAEAAPYPETVRLRYYYMYEDETDGLIESVAQSVRQIKTK